jgi:hypothetical protein
MIQDAVILDLPRCASIKCLQQLLLCHSTGADKVPSAGGALAPAVHLAPGHGLADTADLRGRGCVHGLPGDPGHRGRHPGQQHRRLWATHRGAEGVPAAHVCSCPATPDAWQHMEALFVGQHIPDTCIALLYRAFTKAWLACAYASNNNSCFCAQVEAEGNTDSRPLPGFTPRKGKGLPIFGKSKSDPPVRKVGRSVGGIRGSQHCPVCYCLQTSRCMPCAGHAHRLPIRHRRVCLYLSSLQSALPCPLQAAW